LRLLLFSKALGAVEAHSLAAIWQFDQCVGKVAREREHDIGYDGLHHLDPFVDAIFLVEAPRKVGNVDYVAPRDTAWSFGLGGRYGVMCSPVPIDEA
jgi:hypothetical protein